jgi:methionine-S-sulfoxide reductase
MRLFLFLLTAILFGSPAMAARHHHHSPHAPGAPQTAIFAGGCFWCMQPSFDETQGVSKTEVGYTGGASANPTYEQVTRGDSGHVEAIRVTYDPEEVPYSKLLDIYWQNIDPFDAGGQFADRGEQYHTAIFVEGEEQKKAAEASKAALEKKFAPQKVATAILPAQPFYVAEDYHQKYYQKNSARYTMYKYGSGRVGRLSQIWGKKEE